MERNYTINIVDWSDHDFEEFIYDNSSLFYAFAYRYIKDKQDIKDILQECYIKMWNDKKRIASLESPLNYIFTMIKNSALNHLRYKSKLFIDINEITKKKDSSDFMDNIFEAECSKIIADAVRELSPQSREVINLIIAGYTMEEVATELNLSINTVRTVKYRAYSRLSKVLPPKLFGFIIFLILAD